jgi:hypothetical protein
MAYQYDVFVSYRRQQLWTVWTRDHFKTLLEAYLGEDLGFTPAIFVDERIEVGADWVNKLAENLATSKVLVAIFSGGYFGSDWCLHELDMMLERSSTIPHAAVDDARLIIPVIVHDGDRIPLCVQRLQPAHFEKFRNPYINVATPDYQEFCNEMSRLSPQVAKAIGLAPPHDPLWIGICKQRFNDIFAAASNGKTLDPQQFVPQRPVSPTQPPRLNPAP